ncbi:uncharacterized protein Z520_00098 [Fonsecaea multimorphosa CBS 102226]|uniref:Uncharacterized protein n=1 Tax=Fonsecaea multimorphosa CBS 102226 TaxID=1442371 RepID=A0A0D2J228_9EURO|nr:uncharacterized protein Z520_00098 [Fonsecaea multimorphosa CBS 102226]KIY03407.1 hypothetical protein Z520_00098 [Fonsecaea multimorphosa CBS 102226]
MTFSIKHVLLAGITLSTAVLGQDCGRFAVFTDRGASSNYYNCDAFIDDAMMPYLAWFNGTTTLTLTGGPASECPDKTWQKLNNSLLIGGMTVPGNKTLDRTKYDNNTFYFYMPEQSNDNITVEFQSSSDEWYSEPQGWQVNATKAGDGYDIAGYWFGKLPDNNYLDFPGVPGDDCWDSGPIWLGQKGYFDEYKWKLVGHVSPKAANFSVIMTEIDDDGEVWHIYTNFTGEAGPKGPKLVTTGKAPTTDAKA